MAETRAQPDEVFTMPSFGADMEKGTVVQWLVKPGDVIHRGQILLQVETDKGLIDVESFRDAVVDELLVPERTTALVGAPLARLRPDGAAAVPAAAPNAPPGWATPPSATPPSATPPSPAPPPAPPPAPTPAPTPGQRVRASPLAKARAAELHVDLSAVQPAHGARIMRADVEAAAGGALAAAPREERPRAASPAPIPSPAAPPAASAPPALSKVEPAAPHAAAAPPALSKVEPAASTRTADEARAAMRRAIAASMARSKREIPHYYLSRTVDMSATLSWMASANELRPVARRLLLPALLLRAVARAAVEHPDVNGQFVDGAFAHSDAAHVSFAVALRGGGLIAPAIFDADTLSVDELMAAIGDVTQRVRGGGLRARELSDGSITLTSLGDVGADELVPVIQPPQVGIVGAGAVVERPWVVDGEVLARPVMTLTFAGDHRVSDGVRGARFLHAVEHLLLHPEEP